MFAILINEDNLQKVLDRIPEMDAQKIGVNTYLKLKENWYAITGYVASNGKMFDWTILPEYIVKKNFEYDPIKIQTDWDQIVRK